MTIAVVNHKGGSAKTTSVVNLAGVFATEMAKRVLVIDMDSQANCTMGLGVDPYRLARKKQQLISDVLRPSEDDSDPTANLRDAIMPTDVPGLDIAPSSLELSNIEFALFNAWQREQRLGRLLQPVRAAYDLILIDCPPSLGIFTANALFAADYVLIPVEAAYYGVAGLSAILGVVKRVQSGGRHLEVLGAFNTRVQATTAAREAMETTRKIFPDRYIDCPIVNATASEKSVKEGQPLVVHDPKHKVSVAYRKLARELLRRLGQEDSAEKPLRLVESPSEVTHG